MSSKDNNKESNLTRDIQIHDVDEDYESDYESDPTRLYRLKKKKRTKKKRTESEMMPPPKRLTVEIPQEACRHPRETQLKKIRPILRAILLATKQKEKEEQERSVTLNEIHDYIFSPDKPTSGYSTHLLTTINSFPRLIRETKKGKLKFVELTTEGVEEATNIQSRFDQELEVISVSSVNGKCSNVIERLNWQYDMWKLFLINNESSHYLQIESNTTCRVVFFATNLMSPSDSYRCIQLSTMTVKREYVDIYAEQEWKNFNRAILIEDFYCGASCKKNRRHANFHNYWKISHRFHRSEPEDLIFHFDNVPTKHGEWLVHFLLGLSQLTTLSGASLYPKSFAVIECGSSDPELAGGASCLQGIVQLSLTEGVNKNLMRWNRSFSIPWIHYFEEITNDERKMSYDHKNPRKWRGRFISPHEMDEWLKQNDVKNLQSKCAVLKHGNLGSNVGTYSSPSSVRKEKTVFGGVKYYGEPIENGHYPGIIEYIMKGNTAKLTNRDKDTMKQWECSDKVQSLKNDDGSPFSPTYWYAKRHATPFWFSLFDKAKEAARGMIRCCGPHPSTPNYITVELTFHGDGHILADTAFDCTFSKIADLVGDEFPQELKKPKTPQDLWKLARCQAVLFYEITRSKGRPHCVMMSVEPSMKMWKGKPIPHVAMLFPSDCHDEDDVRLEFRAILDALGLRYKSYAGATEHLLYAARSFITVPKEFLELILIILYILKFLHYRDHLSWTVWRKVLSDMRVPVSPFNQFFTRFCNHVACCYYYPAPKMDRIEHRSLSQAERDEQHQQALSQMSISTKASQSTTFHERVSEEKESARFGETVFDEGILNDDDTDLGSVFEERSNADDPMIPNDGDFSLEERKRFSSAIASIVAIVHREREERMKIYRQQLII